LSVVFGILVSQDESTFYGCQEKYPEFSERVAKDGEKFRKKLLSCSKGRCGSPS
jgi:hypothetical protein